MEVDANLVTTLSKDEVARHISQVFCLECLAASHLHTARCLLSALVQVLPQVLPEDCSAQYPMHITTVIYRLQF